MFETSWDAFQSSKALNQPLGDCVFGCIHLDSRCHKKKDIVERLLGYSRCGPSSGGIMEVRDSGTSLIVVTRSPSEPSSDYVRGMASIVSCAFFDSLMFPMFISLPNLGPKSTTLGIIMMLSLVVIASFVIQFFLCRQLAFYRLLVILGLALSVRYWYTTQLCNSGLIAKLCPGCHSSSSS